MQTDNELIQEYLRSRSEYCFNELYSRYGGKVYAKCISILKDEVKAKDAAQEIFTKIFLNLHKFGERSKFSTWIYSITYNYCIDAVRRTKKSRSLFAEEVENPPDVVEEVPDEALFAMEVSRLKYVLDALSADDRAVLLMKYQEEYQIKQIATMLGKTESAVKMKIKRAKHKAKRIYDTQYAEPV